MNCAKNEARHCLGRRHGIVGTAGGRIREIEMEVGVETTRETTVIATGEAGMIGDLSEDETETLVNEMAKIWLKPLRLVIFTKDEWSAFSLLELLYK